MQTGRNTRLQTFSARRASSPTPALQLLVVTTTCPSVRNSVRVLAEGHKHRDILAIVCDSASRVRREIPRQGLITSSIATTHRCKGGSLLPTRCLLAQSFLIHRVGIATPTAETIHS